MATAITPATVGTAISMMATYGGELMDVGAPVQCVIQPLATYAGRAKFARCSCGTTATDAASLAAATHAPPRGALAADGSHLWSWQIVEAAPVAGGPPSGAPLRVGGSFVFAV